MFGESNYSSYGPDQLVSEDVIVVTFNYRLGILGKLPVNRTNILAHRCSWIKLSMIKYSVYLVFFF